MFFLLFILWLIRETKVILFYLYLWQLKEYHIGRFIDHFRTEKGKTLIFNPLHILKILLIFGFFIYPLYFQFILFAIYTLEVAKTLIDFLRTRLKKPVLTKKTASLILIGLFFVIFFAFANWISSVPNFLLKLLIFDIFTPAIISGIVLIFQPLAVLGRNQIIKKAKKKREQFKNLIVIGITGSYGKTSTKEFLATILSEKYRVLKTVEHQNSEMGISQCILNDLKPEHEIFVVEMGAYNRGGIKLLCEIVRPQIGILTGINEQHLATFGSLENIIKTKYELIESLPETGFAVFNGDNQYCQKLYQQAHISKRICYTKLLVSDQEIAVGDFWIKEIKVEKESLSFKVFSRWEEIAEFKTNLLGKHYAQNILMAAIVAKEVFGMTLDEIAKACQKIRPKQGGVQLKKTVNDLNIIDATYSANPDGVIFHLEYLKIWPGKKVIVMPCLIELGNASKRIHKEIGEKIGEVCDLAIITTKERFQEISQGAVEKGLKGENILFTDNPKEIFKKIKSFCNPGDVVLLEGRVPAELIKQLI